MSITVSYDCNLMEQSLAIVLVEQGRNMHYMWKKEEGKKEETLFFNNKIDVNQYLGEIRGKLEEVGVRDVLVIIQDLYGHYMYAF